MCSAYYGTGIFALEFRWRLHSTLLDIKIGAATYNTFITLRIPPSTTTMSASTDSKTSPTDNPVQDELSYCPPRFTLAGLAAIYSNSKFALGFSNAERQAAACALLRKESHLDGTHYHTRTPGGLHPAYVAFNKIPSFTERPSLSHEDFVEAGLEDVFDAVRTMSILC